MMLDLTIIKTYYQNYFFESKKDPDSRFRYFQCGAENPVRRRHAGFPHSGFMREAASAREAYFPFSTDW